MTKQQFMQIIGAHINAALEHGLPPDDVMIVLELHKLGVHKEWTEWTDKQPMIMHIKKPLPPGQQ